MMNATVHKVVKHSMLYSYVLSQPFATYVDVYPALENKILMNSEQLSYGEQGESVRVLQHKLYQQAYYTGNIDGTFGVKTENALKDFQQQHNVTKSGQTDRVTIEQLLEREKQKYMENIKGLSDSITPGMKSDNVVVVQEALSYFGYYEGNIDGIYGPLTLQALQTTEEEHDVDLVSEVTAQALETIYEEVEEEQVSEVENVQEKEQENENATTKTEQSNTENTDVDENTSKEVNPKQVKVYPNHGGVVNNAYDQIGTPYVWGGSSPSGFDCSGFIQFVFEKEDKTIPRTVSEIWNFSTPVDQPSVGDLVFFETYKAGASHAGIYVGDGKFIHAGESRGVEVSNLDQSYWKERYIGANRIQ